jgi:hypothetical protein
MSLAEREMKMGKYIGVWVCLLLGASVAHAGDNLGKLTSSLESRWGLPVIAIAPQKDACAVAQAKALLKEYDGLTAPGKQAVQEAVRAHYQRVVFTGTRTTTEAGGRIYTLSLWVMVLSTVPKTYEVERKLIADQRVYSGDMPVTQIKQGVDLTIEPEAATNTYAEYHYRVWSADLYASIFGLPQLQQDLQAGAAIEGPWSGQVAGSTCSDPVHVADLI